MIRNNKIAAIIGHALSWLRRRPSGDGDREGENEGARERSNLNALWTRLRIAMDERQLLPSTIEDGRAFRYTANAGACLFVAVAVDWFFRFRWPSVSISALLHVPALGFFLALNVLRRQRTARYEVAERVWFVGLAAGAVFLPWTVYLLDSTDELALAQAISGTLLLLFVFPLRPAILCFGVGFVPAAMAAALAWVLGHSFKFPSAALLGLFNIPAWILLRIYSDKETKDKVFAVKVTTSTIAHEMRTPMISIEASCLAMRQQFNRYQVKTLTAEQRENPYTLMTIRQMLQSIDRVEDEAARMSKSLNLLLNNASSPKSIPTDTTIAPSIAELVKKFVSSYPFFADADLDNIQVTVKEDFAVWISPMTLELVITNLLKNALHSIQKANKGRILITIEGMPDLKFNILRFKDTGSGMDKSTLSQIFTPFFSTRSNGSGLGLPFSRRVLALFGVTISADSLEKEFAEFTIRFPNVEHRIT